MTALLRQPISLHVFIFAFDGTVISAPVVCQYRQHIFQSFYYFILSLAARIESLMQIHIWNCLGRPTLQYAASI